MFLEHRMRAFQGTFHANPDYALWYGWSEMRRDLAEIKEHAAEMPGRTRPRREALGATDRVSRNPAPCRLMGPMKGQRRRR
jgi:hypothetical protein